MRPIVIMSRRKQSNPKPLKSEPHEKSDVKAGLEDTKETDDESWSSNGKQPSPPTPDCSTRPTTTDNNTTALTSITPKIRLKTNLTSEPSTVNLVSTPHSPPSGDISPRPFLPPPITEPTSTPFICPPCGIRFSSLSTLEAHQAFYCSHRKISDDDSKPPVPIVTVIDDDPIPIASTESTSLSSTGTSAPTSKSSSSSRVSKQYTCTHCCYSADKKVSLNRHMRMHAISPIAVPSASSSSNGMPIATATSHPHESSSAASLSEDRYCSECDIRFSSQKTFRAHKLHYCNSRHPALKSLPSKSNSCTSDSAPTSPNHDPSSPTPPPPPPPHPPSQHPQQPPLLPHQQPFLALPTNPIIIVPYSLFRGATILPGLLPSGLLPNPDFPCFLLPNGSLQPLPQPDLSSLATGTATHMVNLSPVSPKSPKSALSTPKAHLRPTNSESPLDLSMRHHHQQQNRAPPTPPPIYMPQVLVKQGVSKCKECNIVFCKHENYLVHKRHYCSARAASDVSGGGGGGAAGSTGGPATNLSLEIADAAPAAAAAAPTRGGGSTTASPPNRTSPNSNTPELKITTTTTTASYQQLICIACGIKFTALDNLNAHQAYYCPKRAELAVMGPVDLLAGRRVISVNNAAVAAAAVAAHHHPQHHHHHHPHANHNKLSIQDGVVVGPLSVAHSSSGTTSNSGGWKCPCCDIVSATATAAQRHMEAHAAVRAYRCTICKYKGNTLRGMRTHIRMHFDKRTSDLQEEKYISYIVDENETNGLTSGVLHHHSHASVLSSTQKVCPSPRTPDPLHHPVVASEAHLHSRNASPNADVRSNTASESQHGFSQNHNERVTSKTNNSRHMTKSSHTGTITPNGLTRPMPVFDGKSETIVVKQEPIAMASAEEMVNQPTTKRRKLSNVMRKTEYRSRQHQTDIEEEEEAEEEHAPDHDSDDSGSTHSGHSHKRRYNDRNTMPLKKQRLRSAIPITHQRGSDDSEIDDRIGGGGASERRSDDSNSSEQMIVVKKEAIEPEVIITDGDDPELSGSLVNNIKVEKEEAGGGDVEGGELNTTFESRDEVDGVVSNPGISKMEANTSKYCESCDISFTYYSTFVAHKKFYCSSHHGEVTAMNNNNNNNNNNNSNGVNNMSIKSELTTTETQQQQQPTSVAL